MFIWLDHVDLILTKCAIQVKYVSHFLILSYGIIPVHVIALMCWQEIYWVWLSITYRDALPTSGGRLTTFVKKAITTVFPDHAPKHQPTQLLPCFYSILYFKFSHTYLLHLAVMHLSVCPPPPPPVWQRWAL